jgi:hypothetical protein
MMNAGTYYIQLLQFHGFDNYPNVQQYVTTVALTMTTILRFVVDALVLTHIPYTCFLGTLSEGHERVQSIPVAELDFGNSEATTSRRAYQEDSDDARPGNDRQDNLLTFPEGEGDAVTITASDLVGLQPPRFLGNNIVDFYVK